MGVQSPLDSHNQLSIVDYCRCIFPNSCGGLTRAQSHRNNGSAGSEHAKCGGVTGEEVEYYINSEVFLVKVACIWPRRKLLPWRVAPVLRACTSVQPVAKHHRSIPSTDRRHYASTSDASSLVPRFHRPEASVSNHQSFSIMHDLKPISETLLVMDL
jgi:hypothetical protein